MSAPRVNRRQFIGRMVAALAAARVVNPRLMGVSLTDPTWQARVRGLLLGSCIGDALGGPVEFQDPAKVRLLPGGPKQWGDDEILDAAARMRTAERLQLRGYGPLRPTPEPYGQWATDAPAGTVTDDSRFKFITLAALREAARRGAGELDVETLAQAMLDWPRSASLLRDAETERLCAAWLGEWEMAARWVLGERNPTRARPPERLWGGIPTCCGQMSLPPLAALYPGDPAAAYGAAYRVSFFDNGFGKDLNAALTAGLAATLALPAAPAGDPDGWAPVFAAMRATDPFGYAQVPWVTRAVDRWLDFGLDAVRNAQGRPGRVFQACDEAFRDTIKWEAQVPFVIAVVVLAMCPSDPLAALQLSIEWGHDTDSYAQLVGAFVGARYGEAVFPAAMRVAVHTRVLADYGLDLAVEADWLAGQTGGLRA